MPSLQIYDLDRHLAGAGDNLTDHGAWSLDLGFVGPSTALYVRQHIYKPTAVCIAVAGSSIAVNKLAKHPSPCLHTAFQHFDFAPQNRHSLDYIGNPLAFAVCFYATA